MEKNSIEEDIEIDENESYIEKLSIVEKFVLFQKQDEYSNLLNEREKATFSMMMRLNPEALTKIRKEFFAREDETNIEEFIYIFQKHLNTNPSQEGDGFIMETPEQREFVKCMFELFKDMVYQFNTTLYIINSIFRILMVMVVANGKNLLLSQLKKQICSTNEQN